MNFRYILAQNKPFSVIFEIADPLLYGVIWNGEPSVFASQPPTELQQGKLSKLKSESLYLSIYLSVYLPVYPSIYVFIISFFDMEYSYFIILTQSFYDLIPFLFLILMSVYK